MDKKKYLTPKEVAQSLDIPMVTVLRWAHQGKIPCKSNQDGIVFKKNEIIAWANSHNFSLVKNETTAPPATTQKSFQLKKAIERGGFFYHLAGNDIYSVLKNTLEILPLPVAIDKEGVLEELLNREEIASTGIGNGIAIPHPRCTLNLNLHDPVIFVVFLEKTVDFYAVDGKNVFVLFIIFSPSTDIHLKLLSRLSLCLREENFLTLLQRKADGNELLAEIQRIEMQIEKNPGC